MRERSAPAFAEHAEAVRVVDHQPGVVPLAQREQLRQRRDVAVHAEHRVGCHQLAAARRSSRACERARRGRGVDNPHLGARQARAVDEAGVVELVGEHRVAAARQRGDEAEVREVARAEVQRARQAHERGEARSSASWASVCPLIEREAPAPTP